MYVGMSQRRVPRLVRQGSNSCDSCSLPRSRTELLHQLHLLCFMSEALPGCLIIMRLDLLKMLLNINIFFLSGFTNTPRSYQVPRVWSTRSQQCVSWISSFGWLSESRVQPSLIFFCLPAVRQPPCNRRSCLEYLMCGAVRMLLDDVRGASDRKSHCVF